MTTDELTTALREVARLRSLCIELVKNAGRGHILEITYPPDKAEKAAALERGVLLLGGQSYHCRIHDIEMPGGRCPACDAL